MSILFLDIEDLAALKSYVPVKLVLLEHISILDKFKSPNDKSILKMSKLKQRHE